MKKLALSLVVLAGCSHAPVEPSVAPTTITTTPQGQIDPPEAPETDALALSGLGATTTSEAPRSHIARLAPDFVAPRPAQREVSEPPSTIPSDTSFIALRNCIAHYESTDGLDPNVYQFTLGTWRAYGGEGDPSDASRAEQDRIFALAWYDDGPHHWAAQKGRCF